MKMNECTSRTWTKLAEIPTDDLSIEGIAEAIHKEFCEPLGLLRRHDQRFFDDILNAIAEGYIQVCEDGIIVWES